MSLLWVTKGDEKQQGERGMMKSEKWADIIYGRSQGRRNVHDWFLLLLCKSSIWFTEQHIFKITIHFFHTSKFAINYVISFAIYDGFIGQKILKLYEGRKVGHSAFAELPILQVSACGPFIFHAVAPFSSFSLILIIHFLVI